MANKLFIPQKLRPWTEARRRFHLSHAQVQMARELGMNPKKLGRLDNHKQERWKLPLRLFIEECYLKRFGRAQPDDPRPIEAKIAEKAAKKAAKKASSSQELDYPFEGDMTSRACALIQAANSGLVSWRISSTC